MTFWSVVWKLFARNVDVDGRVISWRALLTNAFEFPLIVAAEQDVVQTQLRVLPANSPVEYHP